MIFEGVDTLVLAQGHAPDNTLADALSDYPAPVQMIGDCLAARTAGEAVLEGLKAAVSLCPHLFHLAAGVSSCAGTDVNGLVSRHLKL